MVVQIRAISKNTTQQAGLLFKERAAQLRARVAEKIADAIVEGSPVDTGTYIMAHVAGSGESSEIGSRSSHGKPRGRDPGQFKNLARGNLKRSVSASAIQAGDEIWFRNRAEHAARVEYLGWNLTPAYHVYANARAMAPQFIRDAAREMGFTSR
jgi:hypothetical protein